MDWCRLHAGYYRDPALVRAGEAAELLFLRMLGYCAENETHGRVPRAALPLLTPTRSKQRAAALVREHLVIEDGDDLVVRSWERLQEAHDSEAERRRKAREKKRRQRANAKETDGGTVSGTSRGRPRHIEVEEEEEVDALPQEIPPPALVDASGEGHPADQVRAARKRAGLTIDGWTDAACTAAVFAVKDQLVPRGYDQADAWAALAFVARQPDTKAPGRLAHQLDEAVADVRRTRLAAQTARHDARVLQELHEARARASTDQAARAAEARALLAARSAS